MPPTATIDVSRPQPAAFVYDSKPCQALVPFVDKYSSRQIALGKRQIYNPLPARADCFLEFYFSDRYHVVDVASRAVHLSPRSVLVGPHSRRREDILLTGNLDVFSIRLTAIGFRTLFGIPAHAVVNSAEPAGLVLGTGITELEDRLSAAVPSARAAVAEMFLLERLLRVKVSSGLTSIAAIARSLHRSHGSISVTELATANDLSSRQLQRGFQEHVGLSPKLFARLARLNHALSVSRRAAKLDWADVAVTAGYFDHSHMLRDFSDLIGLTPVEFTALYRRAGAFSPDREKFGDVAFVLSPADDGRLSSAL